MKNSSMFLKRCVTAGVLVPFVGTPIVAQAALNDVVLLWGNSSNGPEMVGQLGTENVMTAEQACNLAAGFVYQNLASAMSSGLDTVLQTMGIPVGDIGMGDLPLPTAQDCENSGSSGGAWYIFTTCSMIMGNGPYWMRWTVPPLAEEASMVALDSSRNEVAVWKLDEVFEFTSQQYGTHEGQAPMDLGTLNDFDITDGSEAPVTLEVSLTGMPNSIAPREYIAQIVDFSFSGSIAPPMGVAGVPAMLEIGRIESFGQAKIVADAPGADVVGQFYANFTGNVLPATGGNSVFTGMMRQMAGLAARGIPVDITQTTRGGMALQAIGAGGMVGSESTSRNTIERIMIVPGAAASNCGGTVYPEGVDVVDLGAQMAEASAQAAAAMGEMTEDMSPEELAMLQQMGGAGGLGAMPGGAAAAGAGGAGAAGGASGQMAPEQQAAMAQAAGGLGAMLGGLTGAGAGGAEMTAEQQAAMQQVSGMLGGLLGGAAAGSVNVPGAAAAGASPGAAAPAVARPSGPSLSSALMTDDLTQSAQNLLEALGYDPGNTDGELSVETSIAISQFQAEQGLEVTGEVTPQLVGMLAAQVDAL